MRISKAKLKAIIKEELSDILSEIDKQDAARVADLLRTPGSGVPAVELVVKATNLIDNIKKRAIKQKGGRCVDWVDHQAKKRGWDMNKLTPQQADNYVKLHQFCERRRSAEYQADLRKMKKRRGASTKLKNPYKHAAAAVEGGRASRYLGSLGSLGMRRLREAVQKEYNTILNEKVDKIAMLAVMKWVVEQGEEMLRDEVFVQRLQKWAKKILDNPAIRGGQLGAYATKLAGGALTALGIYQMYQDMSEMLGDPNKAAEWNDGIASGLEIVGAGLAKHGMPASPKYWGVDSCDDLHGYALQNACARWERKEQIATSPKAAQRQGGGKQWQGRIFPPLQKGGGYRTWEELTSRERNNPKNFEKWIRWRKRSGKQGRGDVVT
ncbi:MAG: hypothetical protein F3745_00050 [Nitrospinae bacterium]|nr:hypothetical protein [Nitrospinota bacterium]